MPDALDKLDADAMVDEYARAKGAPPNIIRSEEQVAGIREARAQAQAEQAQAMQAAQSLQSAKTLSEMPMDEGSALDGVLGSLN